MKYSVRHQTQYFYSEPVAISYNRVHAQPKDYPFQHSGAFNLVIDPEPAFLTTQLDFFRNPVSLFTVQSSHTELSVVVSFEAEVESRNITDQGPPWEAVAGALRRPTLPEPLQASQYRFDSTLISRSESVTEFARTSFVPNRPLIEASLDLCQRIYREFSFDPTATQVSTPVEDVLQNRRGVCQDFAHLAIASLRGLGLAARYVSGYLLTQPPPGKPKLQGADASHAWISVWVPDQGWVDFDPTNNCLVGQQHITLATGRDYQDVCPLRGVMLGGGQQRVVVGVDVKEEALGL